MPLTIEVRLRSGIYEAAATNNVKPEWPPAPARVFCALTAAAETDAEWAALRGLETQPEPEVWADAPLLVSQTGVAGYVVNNKTEAKGSHQTWPGRKSTLREKVGTVTATGRFALAYPDSTVDESLLKALAGLAWKVPYLGRSTGDCEITIHDGQVEREPEWTVWAPFNGTGSPTGICALPAPYPGYLDGLQTAYAAGAPASTAARSRPYAPKVALEIDVERPEPVTGPFSDLLVFDIEDLRGLAGAIPGAMAGTVAEQLRKAVMSTVDEPIPPAVSGKNAEEQTHVAYLPLLNVGNVHAKGTLMGVAVAIPAGMSPADRRALLRPLLPNDPARPGSTTPAKLTELRVDDYVRLRLRYRTEHEAWGLNPERWTCAREGGATDWVSVTPVMLDRYTKKRDREEDAIADALERAGYPRPSQVKPMPRSPVPGAPSRIELSRVLANHPGRERPMRHCRIRFDQPVIGPVIAGRLRYRGIGLFIPDTTSQAKERREH